MYNKDQLYPTRLFCYQLRKKSQLSRRNIAIIFLLALTWFTLNERYALKLIFEQECLDKMNNQDRISHCLRRTWERYTHHLSEKDAALLNIDVQSPCSKIVRFGHLQDGGWDICGDDFQPTKILSNSIQTNNNHDDVIDPRIAFPCIVYSFGINDDPSFDKDLVFRYPTCTIYAFDPSINRESGDDFLGPNIRFFSIGIGSEEGINSQGWKIMTLDAIMKMLDHKHINLLKMDVEGSEWATFKSWEKTGVYRKIGQLVGEIHFSQTLKSMIEEVRILNRIRHEFGLNVFQRNDNFRWSKLVNINYSEREMTSIRTYRCMEIGWRRSE